MARWTALLKRLLPTGLSNSLALLRRLRAAIKDLPPGQVEELLRHAHASGIGNLLHLLKILEIDHGHRASAQTGAPQDASGQPLPWFTYPAIAYLEQLDLSDLSVFEFGSGAGTGYFGRRARQVVSVEKDADWHARVLAKAPPTVKVLLRPERAGYLEALREAETSFDVIVIDGAWRRDCGRAALERLSPTGWIILDNADWFPHTAADLRQADLLQVDFTGLGPVNYYTWTTSFFMRRAVRLKPRGTVQPAPGVGALVQCGKE